MHLFVRNVMCTETGAYLAGLAWGFGSFHFAHLIHLQLQSLYFSRSRSCSCIESSQDGGSEMLCCSVQLRGSRRFRPCTAV